MLSSILNKTNTENQINNEKNSSVPEDDDGMSSKDINVFFLSYAIHGSLNNIKSLVDKHKKKINLSNPDVFKTCFYNKQTVILKYLISINKIDDIIDSLVDGIKNSALYGNVDIIIYIFENYYSELSKRKDFNEIIKIIFNNSSKYNHYEIIDFILNIIKSNKITIDIVDYKECFYNSCESKIFSLIKLYFEELNESNITIDIKKGFVLSLYNGNYDIIKFLYNKLPDYNFTLNELEVKNFDDILNKLTSEKKDNSEMLNLIFNNNLKFDKKLKIHELVACNIYYKYCDIYYSHFSKNPNYDIDYDKLLLSILSDSFRNLNSKDSENNIIKFLQENNISIKYAFMKSLCYRNNNIIKDIFNYLEDYNFINDDDTYWCINNFISIRVNVWNQDDHDIIKRVFKNISFDNPIKIDSSNILLLVNTYNELFFDLFHKNKNFLIDIKVLFISLIKDFNKNYNTIIKIIKNDNINLNDLNIIDYVQDFFIQNIENHDIIFEFISLNNNINYTNIISNLIYRNIDIKIIDKLVDKNLINLSDIVNSYISKNIKTNEDFIIKLFDKYDYIIKDLDFNKVGFYILCVDTTSKKRKEEMKIFNYLYERNLLNNMKDYIINYINTYLSNQYNFYIPHEYYENTIYILNNYINDDDNFYKNIFIKLCQESKRKLELLLKILYFLISHKSIKNLDLSNKEFHYCFENLCKINIYEIAEEFVKRTNNCYSIKISNNKIISYSLPDIYSELIKTQDISKSIHVNDEKCIICYGYDYERLLKICSADNDHFYCIDCIQYLKKEKNNECLLCKINSGPLLVINEIKVE